MQRRHPEAHPRLDACSHRTPGRSRRRIASTSPSARPRAPRAETLLPPASASSRYGAEQGQGALREAICRRLYESVGRTPGDIFVSDGSKCDIGRLQLMFGAEATVALQDPAYPVYVDSSVIMGQTGGHNGVGFDGISYMVCRPENDFFPDLSAAKGADVIFFCSPNNPTGAAATRAQLTQLVRFARDNGSIIVYDAAYALYISDPDCPRTIYEIPGAEECAIETCSFSKYAGFTGVRLGWTVVPEQLRYADGFPVQADFNRIMTTVFNGASNVAQAGGLACLQDEGWAQMLQLVEFYKENAAILRRTFQDMGFSVYGGENAPYVWVGFPGQKSWDVFAEILQKCDIVTTPGSGFGPGGEGFVRASAFGHRDSILEAVERFKRVYGKQ
jgi:LL-diaminopimelate aminotransferase